MKRTENALDSRQVLSVIEKYNTALELLDSYDHQNMRHPKGNEATYVLSYEECRKVIDDMRFGDESELFGKEKDDSFKGSIGNIYQSFGGQELQLYIAVDCAFLLYIIVASILATACFLLDIHPYHFVNTLVPVDNIMSFSESQFFPEGIADFIFCKDYQGCFMNSFCF